MSGFLLNGSQDEISCVSNTCVQKENITFSLHMQLRKCFIIGTDVYLGKAIILPIKILIIQYTEYLMIPTKVQA